MKKIFFIVLSLTTLLTACGSVMTVDEASEYINDEIAKIEQEGKFAALKTTYSTDDFAEIEASTFISGDWYMITDENLENANYLHVVYLENDSQSKAYFEYFEDKDLEYVCDLGTMIIAADGENTTEIAKAICN